MSNSRAEAILAAYGNGRMPHAVLVEGLDPDKNLKFAESLGAAALCSGEGARPCGVCRDCKKTASGVHPDLETVTGGDKAKSFHIDAVRRLRQDAYVKPNEAEARVFILHNVQHMTVQAQNALLKIIEEPPGAVFFVLTCENKAVLLTTVLSRVAVISLEGEPAVEGDGHAAKAKEALDELLRGSELKALGILSAYERDRAGFSAFLAALKAHAASVLTQSAKAGEVNRGERDRLFKIIQTARELEAANAQNAGGLLLVTALSALSRV